jgi:hypothetical protein
MKMERFGSRVAVAVFAALALAAAGCGGEAPPPAPVATPTVTMSYDRAPAGSPVDITYKFVVEPDAHIDQDYRVMVHVVDSDEAQMWTFDHEPPVPTSQWQPGQTIEYTKTEFVPVYPYIGEASLNLGLYSTSDGSRLPLAGEHLGQYAYRVARFQLLPQSENLLHLFKEGWHPSENATDNPIVEWQWTKKEATLAFKNPRKEAVLYLDVDSPGADYHGPQQVEVVVGTATIDRFTITPSDRILRKIALTPEQIGTSDMVDVHLKVDNTFVPAKINPSGSKDTRELGVRVFHAFVDPR